MAGYDPKKLKEMKKLYLLVHPLWGYYGLGSMKPKPGGSGWEYVPIPENQLYRQILEERVAESLAALAKGGRRKGKITAGEVMAGVLTLGKKEQDRIRLGFVKQTLIKPEEVEGYRKLAGRLYRSAVDSAAREDDALFVIVSNSSPTEIEVKKGKPHALKDPQAYRRVVKREHELKLLRYARNKLRRRAIILQENMKPAALFQAITARGYKLVRNPEIEAFGEIARANRDLSQACVPDTLNDLLKHMPKMQEAVRKGKIFETKEPPVYYTVPTPKGDVRIYTNGKIEKVPSITPIPKGVIVSHRKPSVTKGKPIYWINLARSGIPPAPGLVSNKNRWSNLSERSGLRPRKKKKKQKKRRRHK